MQSYYIELKPFCFSYIHRWSGTLISYLIVLRQVNPVPEVYTKNQPVPHSRTPDQLASHSSHASNDEHDESLQRVLAMTREEADTRDYALQQVLQQTKNNEEEKELRRAMQLSMQVRVLDS